MIFEIWYYSAKLPNSLETKGRPILIIGDDSDNKLRIIDIHYCIVSASAPKGEYDIQIDAKTGENLGLEKASVIKTTKVYTGDRELLERKVCELPKDLKSEFIEKYKAYQNNIIDIMLENNESDASSEV
jgi:hypothetical protein